MNEDDRRHAPSDASRTDRVGRAYTFVVAAYNSVRLPKLLAQAAT